MYLYVCVYAPILIISCVIMNDISLHYYTITRHSTLSQHLIILLSDIKHYVFPIPGVPFLWRPKHSLEYCSLHISDLSSYLSI